jgi:hypothetical protein
MADPSSPPTPRDPVASNTNAGDLGAATTPGATGSAPAIAFSSPPRGSSRSGPELTSQLNSVLDDEEEDIIVRRRAEEERLVETNRLIRQQAAAMMNVAEKTRSILIPIPDEDIITQMWIAEFKRLGRTICTREEQLRMLRFAFEFTVFDMTGAEVTDTYLPQRRPATQPPSDAPSTQRLRSSTSLTDAPAPSYVQKVCVR